MDIVTTCETELDTSKSLISPYKIVRAFQHERVGEMKKAFRRRKKIIKDFGLNLLQSLKDDLEDDPRHHWLPNPVFLPHNIENKQTPKIDFFPLNRPNRNKKPLR